MFLAVFISGAIVHDEISHKSAETINESIQTCEVNLQWDFDYIMYAALPIVYPDSKVASC